MECRKIERTASRSGFTLVEVLLVVAILGILAGIVVGNYGKYSGSSRIKATRASISTLTTLVQNFQIDVGRLPNSLDELVSNPGDPNWQGPYIMGGKVAVDVWGTPFQMTSSSDGFKISSAGPDKQMGSADDITSF